MRADTREFTIGIACALSVVVLWSSFHLVSRVGVQTSLTPYDLVTLRVGVGGVPLHFAFFPSKFDTAPLIDIGGQALYQGFLSMIISLLLCTRAVGALGASLTTMITASVPVTAALAALVILGEPLTVLTIVAIVLVTIGMFGAMSGGRTVRPAKTPAPAAEEQR